MKQTVKNCLSLVVTMFARWTPALVKATCVLFLALPLHAFAQTVLDAPPIDPDLPNDPNALVALIITFVKTKNGLGIGTGIVLGLCALARKYGHVVPKLGPWLKTKLGGWVLNFATSASLALLGLAVVGDTSPVAIVSTLLSAFGLTLTAAGGLELLRDAFGKKVPDDTSKAAGVTAAADPGKTLGQ